jgi:hypothetical protein
MSSVDFAIGLLAVCLGLFVLGTMMTGADGVSTVSPKITNTRHWIDPTDNEQELPQLLAERPINAYAYALFVASSVIVFMIGARSIYLYSDDVRMSRRELSKMIKGSAADFM